MRPRLDSRKAVIAAFVKDYFLEYNQFPTEPVITRGTGFPAASVHRYLVEMREAGEFSDEGKRNSRPKELANISVKHAMPVLGYVACGPGQEEEEALIEYIHMPECMVGSGEFFALIAKGESMIGAGVNPGDYVIVRRQQTAKAGDLIIALSDGKNNLKKLALDDVNQKFILQSCNPDKESFPDIIVDELQVQGIVVGVYHRIESA